MLIMHKQFDPIHTYRCVYEETTSVNGGQMFAVRTRGADADSYWFEGSIKDVLEYISDENLDEVAIINKQLYPSPCSNYCFIELIYRGNYSLIEWFPF